MRGRVNNPNLREEPQREVFLPWDSIFHYEGQEEKLSLMVREVKRTDVNPHVSKINEHPSKKSREKFSLARKLVHE